jgi:hypothetical protein
VGRHRRGRRGGADDRGRASRPEGLSDADHEAHDAGRDTYRFYSAELTARACQVLETESALRVALERGDGVETEPQLEFLRTHACDEIQGYYCSHSLHAADLAELRERHPAGTPWCAPASARCLRVAAG